MTESPSLAIVATGIPASVEDYQVALNAAFAGGVAFGKAKACERLERIADDLQELCDKQALRIGNLEMLAAAQAGRDIKIAMAEANDERLAKRSNLACFADWQESHATDRGCGNCNLRYECRTGEPEDLASIPKADFDLALTKANLELIQKVNKPLNALEPAQPATPFSATHVFKDSAGNVVAQFDASADIQSDFIKPSAFAGATTIDDRGSITPSCTPSNWPKPEQEPVATMPSNTRYTVAAEGHAQTHWDNIHDAITTAQRAVYAGADNTTRALNDLKAGRIAEWSYGFSAVRIYPPQNTASPQRKPLTDEQANSIINGLRTCLHLDSKRVFLKTWLRDWAAQATKEQS